MANSIPVSRVWDISVIGHCKVAGVNHRHRMWYRSSVGVIGILGGLEFGRGVSLVVGYGVGQRSCQGSSVGDWLYSLRYSTEYRWVHRSSVEYRWGRRSSVEYRWGRRSTVEYSWGHRLTQVIGRIAGGTTGGRQFRQGGGIIENR